MDNNVIENIKRCKYCGNALSKKKYEFNREFDRRQFCDRSCFSKYRKEKHAKLLIGKRFDKLLCIDYVWIENDIKIKCLCDCGNEKLFHLYRFKEKHIPKSCGCYKYNYIHGMTDSELYKCWQRMKARCFNPNRDGHKYYYDKGITICEEWMEFNNFKEWAIINGYKDGLSIDRINNNLNYCPENCRWVKLSEQSKNRTNISHLIINGIDKSYTEWGREYGLNDTTIRARVKRGWPEEKLLQPVQ